MTKPFTDVIFQQFKVYLEGVQIPFISISITQGMGGLPEANIVVPAQAGLMDIARFYSPKVHVFFTDRLYNYEDEKSSDKLLFSGIITQVAYSKSKDVSSSVAVSFKCVHRYHLMNEMLIDYTGWLNADPMNVNAGESAIKADTANSNATIIEALAGIKDPVNQGASKEITKDSPDGHTNVLPSAWKNLYPRILGMPGVLYNFWNQMKRSAYNRALRQGNRYYSEAFVKIYQPLAEEGLQFFSRIAGHYPVEAAVQADENRVDPCPETPGIKEKIVIPPARQLYLASSIQAQMTISNAASYIQNSGEMTTIYQIFNNFYDSIDYEILTLASPAEVALHGGTSETTSAQADDGGTGDPDQEKTYPVDTIVKPRIPFYFSPTCNILFPGMYRSINVMYDEANIPTRINLRNLESATEDGYRTNFRAPHSIREAIARKVAGDIVNPGYDQNQPYSLLATTGNSFGAIGLYEQGRGIKQENGHLARWLSIFSATTLGGQAPSTEPAPTEASKIEALKKLAVGWRKRYPDPRQIPLNPYDAGNNISAHQRMLFAAADYAYTMSFARSKAGSVECPFNPFIVPGYPMDILEKNPTYPSFHALCTTVTHTISADSIGTSVQFTAAMTYSELANYYVSAITPMLQVVLGLAEDPMLVGAPLTTRATASDFYRYTLGVGAVAPDEIMDFGKMQVIPKAWSAQGDWVDGSDASVGGPNGGEMNPMLSYEGNLTLVYREIESRDDIEHRFDIRFIDMTPGNYGPQVMLYKDKHLSEDKKFEIGQSQFLTYDSYFGEGLYQQTLAQGNNPSAATPAAVPQTSAPERGE